MVQWSAEWRWSPLWLKIDQWQLISAGGTITLGIAPDQNSQKWGAQLISGNYHIANQIVCCIETYFIPFNISASLVCPIKTGKLKDFYVICCFDINWLSPNITHLVLMSWPLKEIYLHFFQLLTIFCVALTVTFNGYKYRNKIKVTTNAP